MDITKVLVAKLISGLVALLAGHVPGAHGTMDAKLVGPPPMSS